MKIKTNYITIPLIVLLVAVLGSLAVMPNLGWYNTLTLPNLAPSGRIIGMVWTALYILIAVSTILFWNKAKRDSLFTAIVAIFILNGFLNAFWSYVFFSWHHIGWAVFVSAAMALTTYLLIYLIYPKYRVAAYLLVPYALWVTFATYLNFLIWNFN